MDEESSFVEGTFEIADMPPSMQGWLKQQFLEMQVGQLVLSIFAKRGALTLEDTDKGIKAVAQESKCSKGMCSIILSSGFQPSLVEALNILEAL
jgi:hypothetical protein